MKDTLDKKKKTIGQKKFYRVTVKLQLKALLIQTCGQIFAVIVIDCWNILLGFVSICVYGSPSRKQKHLLIQLWIWVKYLTNILRKENCVIEKQHGFHIFISKSKLYNILLKLFLILSKYYSECFKLTILRHWPLFYCAKFF